MLDDEDISDGPSIGDLKNVKPHLFAATMLIFVFGGREALENG
jgi:hypothetical protein